MAEVNRLHISHITNHTKVVSSLQVIFIFRFLELSFRNFQIFKRRISVLNALVRPTNSIEVCIYVF